eukprot:284818032_6
MKTRSGRRSMSSQDNVHYRYVDLTIISALSCCPMRQQSRHSDQLKWLVNLLLEHATRKRLREWHRAVWLRLQQWIKRCRNWSNPRLKCTHERRQLLQRRYLEVSGPKQTASSSLLDSTARFAAQKIFYGTARGRSISCGRGGRREVLTLAMSPQAEQFLADIPDRKKSLESQLAARESLAESTTAKMQVIEASICELEVDLHQDSAEEKRLMQISVAAKQADDRLKAWLNSRWKKEGAVEEEHDPIHNITRKNHIAALRWIAESLPESLRQDNGICALLNEPGEKQPSTPGLALRQVRSHFGQSDCTQSTHLQLPVAVVQVKLGSGYKQKRPAAPRQTSELTGKSASSSRRRRLTRRCNDRYNCKKKSESKDYIVLPSQSAGTTKIEYCSSTREESERGSTAREESSFQEIRPISQLARTTSAGYQLQWQSYGAVRKNIIARKGCLQLPGRNNLSRRSSVRAVKPNASSINARQGGKKSGAVQNKNSYDSTAPGNLRSPG